jgi:hypothetical protein
MGDEKKVRNRENLPKKLKDRVENDKAGINASRMWEPVPTLDRTESEIIYPANPSPTNAQIVIGRDRPNIKAGLYGGAGHTQCGSIDIVVGRMSSVEGGPKSNIFVNPNFQTDAARVYISQKTNIDQNLDLVSGDIGLSKARSAIGLKADAIRIVARQGIKIVTLPAYSEKLSTGFDTKSIRGIELNAGNMDGSRPVKGNPFKRINNLQPIPLGDNLVEAVKRVVNEIEDLSGRFDSFMAAQMAYNRTVSVHTHTIPPTPLVAIPDPSLLGDNISKSIKMFIECRATEWTQQLNLSGFRRDFLTEKGDYWICSRMNRTT